MTAPTSYHNQFSKITQLESLLSNHDWFHEFSDDQKVWKRGNLELQQIRDLANYIGKVGITLWQRHHDIHFYLPKFQPSKVK